MQKTIGKIIELATGFFVIFILGNNFLKFAKKNVAKSLNLLPGFWNNRDQRFFDSDSEIF